jgi:predicted MFS family arabinose efflux permease
MPTMTKPIYHGRKVLAALFLAGFMVYGGGLYCFVLLVPPLTEEFHWSHAATGGLVTAFWLSAPLILLGGAGIKRFGATRLLIAGILIEAVCVALLSTVSSFGEMYALRAAMGVGKVMFAVTLPFAVSRWFSRHYSLGLGLVWAGWHVGGMVLVPIAGVIIAQYGWRAACLAIAAGLLTIGLAPILLTKGPRSPREFGVGLDGDPLLPAGSSPTSAASLAPSSAANSATAVPDSAAAPPAGSLKDLLGSATFWMIVLTTLFFYTTYGGLLTHQPSIVEGAGFSPRLSSLVLGSTAGFAALGGLAGGWCLDRFSVRSVGIAMHVLLLAGPAAGRVYDLTGNYNRTLGLLAASAVLALILSLILLRPKRAAPLPTAGAASRTPAV